MRHSYKLLAMTLGMCCSCLPVACTATDLAPEVKHESMADMARIPGGTYAMGDVFGEGAEDERPVREVTVDDFYLARHEVTVAEFTQFVVATGYKTSAEAPIDAAATKKIMAAAMANRDDKEQLRESQRQILLYGGAGYWDAQKRQWTGYQPQTSWRDPGFAQEAREPVQAVSWDDAIHYCNWLSREAGLPEAYSEVTGELLDEDRKPTLEVARVKGFRLPTEAEWEYAAREGGKKLRFGNGENVARSSEINFRGDEGDHEFLELDGYVGRTTRVGSFPPNSLGLHDMSGNAWEWVSDTYMEYGSDAQSNPYAAGGEERILRGGRWGGDALEIRTSHRSSWMRNDRCNNSGFRVAVSAGR